MKITQYIPALALLSLSFFTACGPIENETSSTTESNFAMDKTLFIKDGLVGDITTEDCTLSGGTKTSCYRFSVKSQPTEHSMGPWCPPNIKSTAEEGGIWLESGAVHQVDGAFVDNLSTFYKDDKWKLFQTEDGKINITDTKESCEAAARPDVDEKYQNHCVECQSSYLDEGAVITYVLPIKPIQTETSSPISRSGVGVAFNGVIFDGPAPTDAILSAYTLAPFDDCGGHVNLHNGYHYHAATGCSQEIKQSDGHAPMIGYAIDGHPLLARLNEEGKEATGLDECQGHSDEARGYHYHVSEAGKNQFIGCFKAEQGCVYEGDGANQTCDASAASGRPAGPPPGVGLNMPTTQDGARLYSHGHQH